MERKDYLKEKKYPKEYKDIYDYLYGLDVAYIFDDSSYDYNDRKSEIEYFNPNIFIGDSRLSYNIRIVDYSNHLFIQVEEKIPFNPNERYKHEKWEWYMFENTEDLLTILKRLINPFLIGELNDKNL